MTRIVKDNEVRRKEILDVAQKLIYSKGYEQMTIQDILDELHISKGAFYHYYTSKQALLEALVEHIQDQMELFLVPIIRDPELPAIVKLQRFIDTSARWKTERKSFLLVILRTWYMDKNALFRQKMQAAMVKRTVPLLTKVIGQGIQAGDLNAIYPDQVSEVVLSLLLGVGEAFAGYLLSSESEYRDPQRIERTVAAYTDALERVLGAPSGSITLMDAETMQEWLTSPAGLPGNPNVPVGSRV
jgi:AcrR family transcriptional regulator